MADVLFFAEGFLFFFLNQRPNYMFSDSGKWVHKRNTWTPLKTRRHPAGTRKLPLYWTGAAKIEGGSFLFVWGQGPDDVSNSLLRNFTTLKAKTLTGWWFFFCFKNSLKSISGWVVWSGFTALKPLVLGAFFFFFCCYIWRSKHSHTAMPDFHTDYFPWRDFACLSGGRPFQCFCLLCTVYFIGISLSCAVMLIMKMPKVELGALKSPWPPPIPRLRCADLHTEQTWPWSSKAAATTSDVLFAGGTVPGPN